MVWGLGFKAFRGLGFKLSGSSCVRIGGSRTPNPAESLGGIRGPGVNGTPNSSKDLHDAELPSPS